MSEHPGIAWLRQQITGRLETARKAATIAGPHWQYAVTQMHDGAATTYIRSDSGALLADTLHRDDEEMAPHIVLNDPRQIIADCEAQLAILDEHHILARNDRSEQYEEFSVVSIGGANKDHGCVTCHYYGMGGVKGYGVCRTVRAVASAYRHKPGYTEHWENGEH